jgi:hypothetical protein
LRIASRERTRSSIEGSIFDLATNRMAGRIRKSKKQRVVEPLTVRARRAA